MKLKRTLSTIVMLVGVVLIGTSLFLYFGKNEKTKDSESEIIEKTKIVNFFGYSKVPEDWKDKTNKDATKNIKEENNVKTNTSEAIYKKHSVDNFDITITNFYSEEDGMAYADFELTNNSDKKQSVGLTLEFITEDGNSFALLNPVNIDGKKTIKGKVGTYYKVIDATDYKFDKVPDNAGVGL